MLVRLADLPPGSYATDPAKRRPYPDTLFPVAAFDEFVKQVVPRFRAYDRSTQAGYDALVAKVGPNVILTHSAAGPLGFAATIAAPDHVRAHIAIEPSGAPDPSTVDLDRLRPIPHLIVWGDHLDSDSTWTELYTSTRRFHDALRRAGGRSTWIDLPTEGRHGNSHMIMMDRDSHKTARLITSWLDAQREGLSVRRKVSPLGCLHPIVVTMLNQVAVLSDIHGVLPALEAVLAEPDVSTADRIVLTGDITAGPQPTQVLDLLTSLGDRVIWISGNADRELLEYRRGQRDTIPDPIAPWAAEQLREDHLDHLSSLPRSLSLSVRGLGKVLFCHATPRDDEEVVLVDSRLDRWKEVFSGLDTDIRTVVCGHTHMPFVRLAHGRLVLNPGSVGMPYGRTGAHWGLLGPGVELRTTNFDIEAAATRVSQDSSYPEITEWADYFLHARATDADALEAFAPRDGRDHTP
ncbi:metallophosphoesterase family protein [Microtetraspora sp. AC03309]|uniref:metallophosphoesterase family protein n=1 Tax=Microtetraspora sp. AC03309 TaxID=2779376 RepID=UPI001E5AAC2B|nr:metallophosphoesterase family protein [Microtetraspora sp. AC03309]